MGTLVTEFFYVKKYLYFDNIQKYKSITPAQASTHDLQDESVHLDAAIERHAQKALGGLSADGT